MVIMHAWLVSYLWQGPIPFNKGTNHSLLLKKHHFLFYFSLILSFIHSFFLLLFIYSFLSSLLRLPSFLSPSFHSCFLSFILIFSFLLFFHPFFLLFFIPLFLSSLLSLFPTSFLPHCPSFEIFSFFLSFFFKYFLSSLHHYVCKTLMCLHVFEILS